MPEYRTKSPELWEDAPWSELGLPAAPIEMEEAQESPVNANDQNELRSEPKQDSGWDGSGWS